MKVKCGPEAVLRLMPQSAAAKLNVAIAHDGGGREWSTRLVDALLPLGDVAIVEVSAPPIDVIVYLGEGLPPQVPSRFGTWRFRFGKGDRIPYFSEACAQAPAGDLVLIDEQGRLLARAQIAVWQGVQLGVTYAAALQQAPLLLAHALAELRRHGSAWLNLRPQAPPVASSRPSSSPVAVAAFMGQGLIRSFKKRRVARGRQMGWYVALQPPGSDAFQTLPTKTLCADPWLVESEGRLFLFFEEMADVNANGRLACVEILGPGQYGERRVILEEPYHLSYPAVFEDRGQWFMIPESSHAGTVDLYIAEEFPWRWRKLRSLQTGLPLVDTTPLRRDDGGWYFFTAAMVGESGCDAYLFTADTLEGEWKWHPANPICSDIRRARMAGPLWRDVCGKLWRPGQDCSIRYGYAVTWNEVLRLDPEGYDEREGSRIEPSWTSDGLGTHTVCRLAGWEARDGILWTG